MNAHQRRKQRRAVGRRSIPIPRVNAIRLFVNGRSVLCYDVDIEIRPYLKPLAIDGSAA